MIGSRATTASACRALPHPPGADLFRIRARVPGRHRKIKLGDWRQPWLRVAGALLLVVSACIHLGLYLSVHRVVRRLLAARHRHPEGQPRHHRQTGHDQAARRPGGAQATYDGHPLYTYAGDSNPGQANGNQLDLNGGYWYEVRA